MFRVYFLSFVILFFLYLLARFLLYRMLYFVEYKDFKIYFFSICYTDVVAESYTTGWKWRRMSLECRTTTMRNGTPPMVSCLLFWSVGPYWLITNSFRVFLRHKRYAMSLLGLPRTTYMESSMMIGLAVSHFKCFRTSSGHRYIGINN